MISWKCKKQTVVANSTTEAEYVAAANCCGHVLWIQNQMLDYRFSFMNTKIYVDNESTICIVKNLVFHSKTKHIEIRHHFIRDSYEKKLIQVIKIHTDHNIADLLTKAFDVSRKAKRTTEISQFSRPITLVTDEIVLKEWEDRMEMAATTASSLEAKQDSDNINWTQSMATLNEFEAASKQSNDPPLLRVMERISHKKTKNQAKSDKTGHGMENFGLMLLLSTSENEEMEITATINGRVKTITEASIRRYQKLEDFDGISTLPNTKFFEQLALMGLVVSEFEMEAVVEGFSLLIALGGGSSRDEIDAWLRGFTLILATLDGFDVGLLGDVIDEDDCDDDD
ncbi:hypothetical protein Tco_1466453 [Tanacetum coccineum]